MVLVHELVDPIGVLHVVPDADLQAFCARHGLGRPDNVRAASPVLGSGGTRDGEAAADWLAAAA